MKRTEQQQRRLDARGRQYARKVLAKGEPRTETGLMRQAYVAGFKAGEGKAVAAPAAALLHVLDTQAHLKATIVQLRAALRMASSEAHKMAYALAHEAAK